MKTTWHSENFSHTDYILAGDIGGTNSTFAIVGKTKNKFEIIASCKYPSREISGPLTPVKETLSLAREKIGNIAIKAGCLSAAGPKQGNFCQPTNIEWAIKGGELEDSIDIKAGGKMESGNCHPQTAGLENHQEVALKMCVCVCGCVCVCVFIFVFPGVHNEI